MRLCGQNSEHEMVRKALLQPGQFDGGIVMAREHARDRGQHLHLFLVLCAGSCLGWHGTLTFQVHQVDDVQSANAWTAQPFVCFAIHQQRCNHLP